MNDEKQPRSEEEIKKDIEELNELDEIIEKDEYQEFVIELYNEINGIVAQNPNPSQIGATLAAIAASSVVSTANVVGAIGALVEEQKKTNVHLEELIAVLHNKFRSWKP